MAFYSFSQSLVRYLSHAGNSVFGGKVQSGQRLSIALEWFSLIIVWSAVLAMGLAVAGSLLGEE